MTDREKAIATLTEHLDHWKRLLSEGICTKDEGERTIYALTMAIKALEQESKQYFPDDVLNCWIGAEVLDKIKAEIMDFEEELFHRPDTDYSDYAAVRHCVEIIDRYTAESEEKE